MTEFQDYKNRLNGKKICFFCGIYIYTGVVTEVNNDFITLKEAKVVYETGSLDKDVWRNAQSLPNPWNIMVQNIESWGPAKC